MCATIVLPYVHLLQEMKVKQSEIMTELVEWNNSQAVMYVS